MSENVPSHDFEDQILDPGKKTEETKEVKEESLSKEEEQILAEAGRALGDYQKVTIWYPPQDSPCAQFADNLRNSLRKVEAKRGKKQFEKQLGALREAVAYSEFCARTKGIKSLNKLDKLIGDAKSIDDVDKKRVEEMMDKILVDENGKRDLTDLDEMIAALEDLNVGLESSLGLGGTPESSGKTTCREVRKGSPASRSLPSVRKRTRKGRRPGRPPRPADAALPAGP